MSAWWSGDARLNPVPPGGLRLHRKGGGGGKPRPPPPLFDIPQTCPEAPCLSPPRAAVCAL